mmetsp:Transcript_25084/g.84102  ORF Transcript_25084/g.84102 Transcript_25084/m.84102 type:complete len:126 (-) Transcript_25084:253-630(-)
MNHLTLVLCDMLLFPAAYLRDVMVGAISCRLEPQEDMTFKLYILTLGVLAPYRRLGIGAKMLQHMLSKAAAQPDIKEAYLHVQVGNEAAKAFYEVQGFTQGPVVKNYYKDIEPPDAWLFSKPITH